MKQNFGVSGFLFIHYLFHSTKFYQHNTKLLIGNFRPAKIYHTFYLFPLIFSLSPVSPFSPLISLNLGVTFSLKIAYNYSVTNF